MISIHQLQSTVAGLINAAAYFTAAPNVVAIADDGTREGEIATQLRTRGAVVVVTPVTRCSRRDSAARKLAADCEVQVRIIINPQVNGAVGAANRVPLEMATEAMAAVLAWPPPPGDRHFDVPEEFLQLSVSDEGLLSYDLFFVKLATIN